MNPIIVIDKVILALFIYLRDVTVDSHKEIRTVHITLSQLLVETNLNVSCYSCSILRIILHGMYGL